MIVATAGHIDHGKTALVRALTGMDADRLPEKKARGFTIDLGYAFMAAPDGASIGFIDVPGHERLVHTMLAGAAGVDFALLLVAADDGPMLQTREHLAILDLLGVADGIVVLTKADRVDAARLAVLPTSRDGGESFPGRASGLQIRVGLQGGPRWVRLPPPSASRHVPGRGR